jgi:glucan endo-1,6-beta-glucosidase
MYVYDYEEASLIQNHIGPALAAASLNTAIWGYDHNTGESDPKPHSLFCADKLSDVPSYPQHVVSNAGQYVKSVAWHCYASNLDWTVLSSFHNSNPGITQYMTECWTPASGAWNQAASFTMGPLQNWASGAIAWTLATDTSDGPHLSGNGACDTCQGLVTISGGSYKLQTAYYMMAQFSKFMPRGATVLNGSGSYTYSDGTGIQSVASLNPDGTRTVVIMNTFSNDVYVTLKTKSGGTWSGNVPTKSVVTWVLPSGS